jgi:cysteinyl-tRNA synthetase
LTRLTSINKKSETEQLTIKQTIKYVFNIIGFEFNQIAQITEEELNNFFNKYGIEYKNIDEAMAQFIKVRNAAREQKDYKLSDELRDELNLIGIKLNDGKDNEWYWSNS